VAGENVIHVSIALRTSVYFAKLVDNNNGNYLFVKHFTAMWLDSNSKQKILET